MRKLLAALTFMAIANGISAQSYTGKWAREKDVLDTPTALIINKDGTFEISRGTVSTRGTYKADNNTITFFDKAGDDMDSYRGMGTYAVSIEDNTLVLKSIGDAATYRNFILTNVRWTRIANTSTTTYIRQTAAGTGNER